MSTENKEKNVVKVILNDNLPALMVDNLSISSRKDGLHYIRLLTELPEGKKEQVRFLVPNLALQNMIKALCSHIGYYPKKTTERVAKKTTEKSK